ncbi:hypothetical protein HEK616_82950 (plasmid) [Streptomyces nigrescens]|uniref:Uncharacterized protein n=1 Tax=Streptomyces nigrescens TaxID=1920 RepID=A0ABM8A850_STRNI|nr:hypothetical protein HEK616_82950 [Streptomyces nigrescens]
MAEDLAARRARSRFSANRKEASQGAGTVEQCQSARHRGREPAHRWPSRHLPRRYRLPWVIKNVTRPACLDETSDPVNRLMAIPDVTASKELTSLRDKLTSMGH